MHPVTQPYRQALLRHAFPPKTKIVRKDLATDINFSKSCVFPTNRWMLLRGHIESGAPCSRSCTRSLRLVAGRQPSLCDGRRWPSSCRSGLCSTQRPRPLRCAVPSWSPGHDRSSVHSYAPVSCRKIHPPSQHGSHSRIEQGGGARSGIWTHCSTKNSRARTTYSRLWACSIQFISSVDVLLISTQHWRYFRPGCSGSHC